MWLYALIVFSFYIELFEDSYIWCIIEYLWSDENNQLNKLN